MTFNEREYLANQLNGPVVYSLLHAMWDVWNTDENLVQHIAGYALEAGALSTQELNWLGTILAIPRPYGTAPSDDESFLYGADGYFYPRGWREQHALSSTDAAGTYGGQMQDMSGELISTGTVGDATYVQYMLDMVRLRNSYSIDSICSLVEDLIAPVVAPSDPQLYYKWEFDNIGDLRFTIDSLFSRYNDYLQSAFNRTFTGSPRVFVLTGVV